MKRAMAVAMALAAVLLSLGARHIVSHLAHVRDVYGVDAWVTKRAYSHVATNWWCESILQHDLSRRVVTNCWDLSSSRVELHWRSSRDHAVTGGCVRVYTMASFDSAVDVMMRNFSECVSAQPFPAATGTLVGVGDYCYTSYPTGSCSYITFVRNNVWADIDVADPDVATNLAIRIDAAVLAASTNDVANLD